jgi:hypothetical protein
MIWVAQSAAWMGVFDKIIPTTGKYLSRRELGWRVSFLTPSTLLI